MPAGSILMFWGVAALLIAVPGPDWAFAISAGLRGRVVSAAGGIALGYLAVTTMVAAGLGILIASTSIALTALTIAGGLYLVWLGIRTWRDPTTPSGSSPAASRGRRGTLLQGAAVSGLNPKGLLVFVAVLPQFTDDASSWPLPVQLTILGVVFAATCGVAYLIVGACAQRLLAAQPAASRFVSRTSGAAMVVIGAILLVEHMLA